VRAGLITGDASSLPLGCDAAGDDDRPPIFKLGAAPNGPVMAERGELLRWLLRRARRFPVSEA